MSLYPSISETVRHGCGNLPAVDVIDIDFDFRSDTPGYGRPGVDPDKLSPRLRCYHQFLWSKPLPSGERFALDVTTPGVYLHHHSELGEFRLSSEAVVATLSKKLKRIIEIPDLELEEFNRIGYTIGGMMIWPGNQVDGGMTINQARGFDWRIADRFDLTVECIRRYYLHESSPGLLSNRIAKYPEYFGLFRDFAGFVDFFLLQDLVDEVTSTVKFFTPFKDLSASPLPGTLDAYRGYRQRAIEFIESRNRRIAAYVANG